MISIGALFTIACAVSAVEISPNDTNTDKHVLKRLTSFLNTTSNIEPRDIDRLNQTAQKLGIDRDLVSKLAEKLKHDLYDIKTEPDSGYNVYDDGAGRNEAPKVNAVNESPDYASSVVLASDLLSLTSAVANVKEKVCREQGYRFLNGLILNKRWALKSKYYFFITIIIFQILLINYLEYY